MFIHSLSSGVSIFKVASFNVLYFTLEALYIGPVYRQIKLLPLNDFYHLFMWIIIEVNTLGQLTDI